MERPLIQFDAVTIVVRGHFNPAIFSPAWMLAEGLVGPAEYKVASVDVIAREVAIFTVDWLQCRVSLDTLELSTSEPSETERLRDAMVGVLKTLRHTPIAVMGINRNVHIATESDKRWHEIGDTLVPKNGWDSILDLPGTRNLKMQGVRSDQYSGFVQVEIEPSSQVQHGIFIVHNDHYGLVKVAHQPATRTADPGFITAADVEPSMKKSSVAVEILTKNWSASMARSDKAVSFVANVGRGA